MFVLLRMQRIKLCQYKERTGVIKPGLENTETLVQESDKCEWRKGGGGAD